MRARNVLVLCGLLLTVLSSPASAAQLEAEYNMPSSAVVRGVFGIGRLLCADPNVPPEVTDAVKNGPCFEYSGYEGKIFVISARDDVWADTSVTAAVDVNGDGCVSDSCNGQPNDADYRVSNCGPSLGVLPFTDVTPVMQIFLRVIDVTGDLQVCGASRGLVHLDIAA